MTILTLQQIDAQAKRIALAQDHELDAIAVNISTANIDSDSRRILNNVLDLRYSEVGRNASALVVSSSLTASEASLN